MLKENTVLNRSYSVKSLVGFGIEEEIYQVIDRYENDIQ